MLTKDGRIRQFQRGYSLPEVLIGAAVVLVIAALLVALLQVLFTLYAKNFALNDAHASARGVADRLARRLHSVVDPPVLLDKNGAVLPGDGPASGILCVSFSSQTPFLTSNAINLNSKTIQTNQISPDQPIPSPGDHLFMPQIHDKAYDLAQNSAVLARISSVAVSGGGTNMKLDFEQDIGSYFDPPPSGPLVIAPGQPYFILSRSAFVVVSTGDAHQLRYYPSAMSIEQDGAAAFDDPANFRAVAELLPQPGDAECRPFRYTDPARRFIDIQVRTLSRRYDQRLRGASYAQSSWRTAVGFRSPPLKIMPSP